MKSKLTAIVRACDGKRVADKHLIVKGVGKTGKSNGREFAIRKVSMTTKKKRDHLQTRAALFENKKKVGEWRRLCRSESLDLRGYLGRGKRFRGLFLKEEQKKRRRAPTHRSIRGRLGLQEKKKGEGSRTEGLPNPEKRYGLSCDKWPVLALQRSW